MKRTSWYSLLLAAGLLAACDQPEEGLIVCETEAPVSSVTEFHRVFAPPTQVFEASSSRSTAVQLTDGSRLTVPAGAFARLDGTPVSGSVELRVQALTRPVDMLLGGLPSMTNARPLETAGQLHLSAWLPGSAVPLRLRPGHSIAVDMPQAPTAPASNLMQWKGVPVTSSTLTFTEDTVRVHFDATSSRFRTRVYTDSLGWFNLGRYWTSAPADTTLLRVDVGGDAAARVYLLPTQRSGVFLMRWNSQTRLMELYGVPAGTELKIIVLRAQAGQVLVGAERVTLRSGTIYRPALQAMNAQPAADFIRQF
ncbi:hypothetical protein EJV47_14700 [Hymenobacter gummosus]|uniref:Uncharacterized protein n=1 Tax=Hymenobacter gummosus TaxID=1776032 RepID=A0A3S0JDA3_9BACT|nr:hypothetical protein [Hymenobacter gummosus]RTQ48845.1 hypothetical protein EJV47_14700 [Hymenobacter gummosus]